VNWSDVDWGHWTAVSLLLLGSLAGIVLTVVTLPGTWLSVAIAAGVAWWRPELLSWYTVGSVLALAAVGEIIEFGASAAGAAKGGASKRGAAGALVGSLVGALVGAPFFFPLGSIVGGVVGAWGGAVLAERGMANRTWRQATRAGTGAAAGRLLATVLKSAVAGIIALVLGFAAFIP